MSKSKFKPQPRKNLDRLRILEHENCRLRRENEGLKQRLRALRGMQA